MTRLHTVDISEATGDIATIFDTVKSAIGKIPNAYATIGSNSPALLQQVMQLGTMLQTKSGLDKRELEAINLAVSEDSGCDYCLAAHTVMGKAAGYSNDDMKSLRAGRFDKDRRIAALVKFALLLVNTKGTVSSEAVQAVQSAGFTDRQIVEAIGAISAILLTNMLNRVNDTTLDFPRAP